MNNFNKLLNKKEMLAVIGLGYVGLPLAIEFAKKINVIGFDINDIKIKEYLKGNDVTKEVGNQNLAKSKLKFSFNEKDLNNISVFIVAVPTPINTDKTPDLKPLLNVSRLIGRNIKKGSIVVFESTVYPGVTEDICAPIIEHESKLQLGKDWHIGYSPERINPGDKIHRVWNIKKIVSADNKETCDEIAKIYNLIIKVKVHKVSSIKTAEAIKVVENSQRDVNIAFMNEIAMVCNKMGIDTQEVIEGMNTKWNALGFKPGLVGGHCIGVDPYYFIYQAEKLGYHSQIILSGRKINDDLPEYIANNVIKEIVSSGYNLVKSKILILGATFKENCSDIRNSKVFNIYHELLNYGLSPLIFDDNANKEEIKKIYNIETISEDKLHNFDCIIFAVAHNSFKKLDIDKICNNNGPKVLIDIKGILNKKLLKEKGYRVWRL